MATLTVYSSDADAEVYGNSATYATARSTSTGTDLFNADTVTVGQANFGDLYCLEGFISFDTSGIPDGATIDSVVLSLYGQNDSSSTDFTIEARLHDWGASVTTADYVAGDDLGSKTLLATFATSGLALGDFNAFTDVAFPANVNDTGETRLVLCSSRHRVGTEPTGNEYVYFSDGSTSEVLNPKLVINYTEAVVASGFTGWGMPC